MLMYIHMLCSLAKLMNRMGFENEVMVKLRDIMQRTIEFREQHNVVRRDLLQLLIRLRNTGKIGEDDDEVWDIETAQDDLKAMSIDKIAAQAFLFYIAGSETTAATSAFTLYELSMYPQLLKEAREELDAVMARHQLKRGDKFTYEAVQDLKFLDLCIMGKSTGRRLSIPQITKLFSYRNCPQVSWSSLPEPRVHAGLRGAGWRLHHQEGHSHPDLVARHSSRRQLLPQSHRLRSSSLRRRQHELRPDRLHAIWRGSPTLHRIAHGQGELQGGCGQDSGQL
ncbi:hypothetical protein KR044_012428 [Drosophila immigrans]|nr:hypothetical protein KR044_012428 [Drosophila immigrans]